MEQTPEQQHNGSNGEEVSAVIATENKGGRPSKYEPETVNLLLAALADGLNQKQACLACGISENTLKTWREKYPEFDAAMTEARETARRKVLAMIKSIGEEDSDWRALDAWLQRSFPADYRRDSINIKAEASATATLSRRQQLLAKGIWEPPTAEDPMTPEEIARLQQIHKERMERIAKLHNEICDENGMEDFKV